MLSTTTPPTSNYATTMVRDKGKEVDAGSCGPTGTFEDPHKLEFNIKDLSANSVVLYPDQAEITRDIENIQLKPGVNEVTIKGLTGYCQEHSIKVEGKGDAIITDMVTESVARAPVSAVGFGAATKFSDSDAESDDEEPDDESEPEDSDDEDPAFAEIRKIDAEIKDIRSQAQDAAEQYKNAEVQLAALERYGGTITAEVAAPETMTQFLDAYQESRKILYEQHKAAKAKLESLENELRKKQKEKTKKLKGPLAAKAKAEKAKAKENAKKNKDVLEQQEQRLAELRLRPWNMYRVKVMVETNSETEASLTLKYLVNNASWFPRYDLRLDSIANSGQVTYRAHFYNKTYETWRDAKITFSSSAQTFGGLKEVVPTLAPWTLSLDKSSPFSNYNAGGDNTAGLYSIKEQQALSKKNAGFSNSNVLAQKNLARQAMVNNQRVPFGGQAPMQQAQIVQAQVMQQQQAQAAQAQAQAQAQAHARMAPQSNIFGTRVEGPHATGGGLFGQQQQQQQLQPAGGLFGASTLGDIATTSGFGAFGAAAPPPPPPTGAGLFGAPGAATAHIGALPLPDTEKDEEGGGGDNPDNASTLAPARASMLIAESSSSDSYGMTTTYEISGLKTIKSSPIVRRQVISTIDLPTVTFTSIAVAKLRTAAFLKARFKNTSKHTFLRGEAGLTVDGSFLGQTAIPHCPPDDTISLSLGVDTGVHVSYAKPTLVSSSQGFISKENVTLYKRSIFIHNAKSQQLTLTVLDQVPVSEDERLKVQVVSPKGLREGGDIVKTGAPGSANLDNKWGNATAVMKAGGNGEITYTVKLEKGRSCKLPLEYEVKLPAGEKMVGLT
ncbi:hypothetical protein Dda_0606 [Drechslerella dactyloides]|uniref:DUF4139 domain-containing protein n=1 Tax=Drechslerella dactyloides TaxID=74499 RepID=A0AAD6NNJ6_DREDA|nr:hypothetical protein Dda_0606 [Drechslerella dactyloides]